MAVFKVETKNKVDIDKKARVYFTCHPDDFDSCFKKVCDDIFKTHDCAIYYTEDMTEVIAEEDKETDLGRNNLFVIPVTFKLLTTPNRAMDEDIPYALEHHIPVLPIMMESGIDEFYSRSDKFGELQYLNPYSTDLTEISYEEKLKKYLESVLISDELAKRVREAFDVYIFLSYRKKDRKYANELMRLIHSNPECRSIAIWFDEFLTPGVSFKENIEKMIDDSKLFTLLVTPRLFEKVADKNGNEQDNYIILTELPLARKNKEEKGIEIFAVEMEKTDKNALSAINIVDYINVNDKEFRARLLEILSEIATTANDSPEHNFLIGLAYLDGIDVEVDYERGIALITSAAEAGLLEAMEKLYEIYKGVGSRADYREAVKWAKKIAEYNESLYGKDHLITLHSLNNLAYIYGESGCYQQALELQKDVYEKRLGRLGETHPNVLNSLNNLGHIYMELKQYEKAMECQEKLYDLRCKKSSGADLDTLIALNNLASTYVMAGYYEKALDRLQTAYDMSCELIGVDDLDTLMVLNNKAYIYGAIGKHQQALELYEKVYDKQRVKLGEEHPNTLTTRNNIAFSYGNLGDREKALDMYKEVYDLRCVKLGKEHPLTITTLNNLASTYGYLGDLKKSSEYQEEVYALRCKIFGEQHPASFTSLNNLIATYNTAGNYQKTAEYQKVLYDLLCKQKGEEHSDTVLALHQLAYINGVAGDYQSALELYKKTYTLFCKTRGEEHRDTLEVLHNLAYFYYICGDCKSAVNLQKKVYDGRRSMLGDQQIETVNALSNYAFFCKEAGELKLSLELYERLCDQQQTIFGKSHPNTIKNLGRMAEVRSKLQDGN